MCRQPEPGRSGTGATRAWGPQRISDVQLGVRCVQEVWLLHVQGSVVSTAGPGHGREPFELMLGQSCPLRPEAPSRGAHDISR